MPIPFSRSRIHGATPALAAALLLGGSAARTLAQAAGGEAHPGSRARTAALADTRLEVPDLSALVPQEARISLRAGTLLVVAKNSSLLPILESVAHMTGMEILNLPEESPRVSGSFGPGTVRRVLIDLVGKSGYSFVMAGGADDSAPAKLLLEEPERNPGGTRASAPVSASAIGERMPTARSLNPEAPLGPGALRPTPADASTDENVRIQRNLERLQHIQEQQEQNSPQ